MPSAMVTSLMNPAWSHRTGTLVGVGGRGVGRGNVAVADGMTVGVAVGLISCGRVGAAVRFAADNGSSDVPAVCTTCVLMACWVNSACTV